MATTLKWKPDWPQAKANFVRWWEGEGLALGLTAPRPEPIEAIPPPPEPRDIEARWTDPVFRCVQAERAMAGTAYLAEAFPYFDTQIGPGSLGTFLGSQPRFVPETVWYEPCIEAPESFGPIRFRPEGNRWWNVHLAVVEEGLRRARGRYLVGMPDLIENIDTLAAMRGTETLLTDLMDRPAWVQARLEEINEAFFESFTLLYKKIKDADGGNAFSAFRVWGPGKTAKVQCDFSCMISPRMFREFVAPPLAAQCDWLDYSVYHLDGPTALQQLDPLLEIESLDAIEWTPLNQAGGSPEWYDLYRRIKAAGKSVEAIGVTPEEVVPLLDAVGPEGMLILTHAPTLDAAERLLAAVEPYRK